jgi:hypothetical protein
MANTSPQLGGASTIRVMAEQWTSLFIHFETEVDTNAYASFK